METEPTYARPMPDYDLNAVQEGHAADELDELSIENQRLAKVQEYEEAALSRPDPFAAVIGMGNASLQRIFEHLGAAILNELDCSSPTVESLREFGPEIRLLVKLRNSIEKDLVVQPPDTGQQEGARLHGKNGNGFDAKLGTNKRGLVPKHWRANG